MMKWRASNNCGNIDDDAENTIRNLKALAPNSFLKIAQEKGYCGNIEPKMSATFWMAMSDEANLRVGQQSIIQQYLHYHLGCRVSAKEADICEIGSDYVKFNTELVAVNKKEYGTKHVKISWRLLYKLI